MFKLMHNLWKGDDQEKEEVLPPIEVPDKKDAMIQELTEKNSLLEDQLSYTSNFFLEELNTLKSQIHEKNADAEKAEKQSLKVQREWLKDALVTAKKEGNAQAEAEISDALMKVHADISTQALKKDIPQKADILYDSVEDRYNPPKAPPKSDASSPYTKFVEKNPWMDPNSPKYNAKLTEEAQKIAQELTNTLSIEGLEEHLYTPEFYETISTELKERYGKSSAPDVPVLSTYSSHTGSSMNSKNSQTPHLTKDEVSFALANKKSHEDGRPYSEKELIHHYWKIKKDHGGKVRQSPTNPFKYSMTFE